MKSYPPDRESEPLINSTSINPTLVAQETKVTEKNRQKIINATIEEKDEKETSIEELRESINNISSNIQENERNMLQLIEQRQREQENVVKNNIVRNINYYNKIISIIFMVFILLTMLFTTFYYYNSCIYCCVALGFLCVCMLLLVYNYYHYNKELIRLLHFDKEKNTHLLFNE